MTKSGDSDPGRAGRVKNTRPFLDLYFFSVYMNRYLFHLSFSFVGKKGINSTFERSNLPA
jgi:hypothetical protein